VVTTEKRQKKILWQLTKYLIKQKYVAVKPTQTYAKMKKKTFFCILTNVKRKLK